MVTERAHAAAARRNAAVAAATGITAAFLFMYPTSTNSADPPPARARAAEPPTWGGAAHPPDDGHGHAADDVVRNAEPFDGPAVPSPYGPVQVRIFVTEGRLVWAETLDYPRNTAVDKVLNDDAVPTLIGWTLLEEGADIDTVSGATHTSHAYRASLQSALDAADL